MEMLELPLDQWRQIAFECKNAELRDYIRQLIGVSGSEVLVLHPVEREEEKDQWIDRVIASVLD